MIVVWIVVGVLAILVTIVVAGANGKRPASTRRTLPPPIVGPDDRDTSPFEYDVDEPMDWWDNQYGEHGFKD